MRIIRLTLLLGISIIYVSHMQAQRNEIYTEQIQSLQVVANEDWMSLPIITTKDGVIDLDFDEMSHNYHRYTYRLEHCEAQWTVSEQLFESDFCQGFSDGNIIDDVRQSILTNTLFTHYHLRLPNIHCRPKISGNYRITIYDDNEEEKTPVLTAHFMVAEPSEHCMGVGISSVTNTDQTINAFHQQIEMSITMEHIQLPTLKNN